MFWNLTFHFLRSVDTVDASIYAEIRTRIPESVAWDYNFEPAGTTPLAFTVKVGHAVKFSYHCNALHTLA